MQSLSLQFESDGSKPDVLVLGKFQPGVVQDGSSFDVVALGFEVLGVSDPDERNGCACLACVFEDGDFIVVELC